MRGDGCARCPVISFEDFEEADHVAITDAFELPHVVLT